MQFKKLDVAILIFQVARFESGVILLLHQTSIADSAPAHAHKKLALMTVDDFDICVDCVVMGGYGCYGSDHYLAWGVQPMRFPGQELGEGI